MPFLLPEHPFELQKEKGTGYSSRSSLVLPRLGIADSNRSVGARLACQSSLPKSCCRLTQVRSVTSSKIRVRFAIQTFPTRGGPVSVPHPPRRSSNSSPFNIAPPLNGKMDLADLST